MKSLNTSSFKFKICFNAKAEFIAIFPKMTKKNCIFEIEKKSKNTKIINGQ